MEIICIQDLYINDGRIKLSEEKEVGFEVKGYDLFQF
jgi:hypothetical protein